MDGENRPRRSWLDLLLGAARLPPRRGARCSSLRAIPGRFATSARLHLTSDRCRSALPVLVAVLATVGCGGMAESEQLGSVGADEESLSFRLTHEIHHLFGDVVSVAVDPDGRVFVADNMVLTVWEFGANGELVDSIGRRGSGPGEFNSLDNIQWTADTLYTFDASLQRLTAFPASGDFTSLRTVTFRGRRGVLSAWVSPMDRSVIYTAAAPVVRAWEITQDQTTVHRVPSTVRVVDEHPDEILLLPVDERLITVRPGAFGMTEPMPFGRSSLVRVGPEGNVYHFWTGEPRIREYAPDGSLLDEIPLPGGMGRPVTPQDMGDLFASIAQFDGRSQRSRDRAIERIESALAENRLPSHWPAATDFVVDEHGRLWVALVAPTDVIRWSEVGGRRYSYASPTDERRHVVVLDPEGGASRSGLLAAAGQIVAVRGNRMYVLTTDPMGVQFVKVFTIDGDR